MEFGLAQLRTGLRPGSSRFELSRHVEIVRTCLQTVTIMLYAAMAVFVIFFTEVYCN